MDPHGLVQGWMQDWDMGGQESKLWGQGGSCPLAENFTCNIASSVAELVIFKNILEDPKEIT